MQEKNTAPVEVKVDCGSGAEAYTVILTGKDLGVFEQAKNHPDVQDKEGEALVAAILAVAPAGSITHVERHKNGRLNDGPRGEPAYQELAAGTVVEFDWLDDHPVSVERYKSVVVRQDLYTRGKRNDGADGTPAVQCFHNNGKLAASARYKDDLLNDGPHGEAAVVQLNDNGTLGCVDHYKDGRRQDGTDGMPASQLFNKNGNLIGAARYTNGRIMKELGFLERLHVQKKCQRQSIGPKI